MRLFVICTVLAVAFAAERPKYTEKRGADVQYVTESPKNYATATTAVLSASTVAPSYSKTLTQPNYLKQNYVQQPIAYEQQSQPIVKYSFAAPQTQAYKVAPVAATPVAYSQPQINYQAYEQPQVSYVQQPEVKYAFAQPAVTKVAPAAKIQYTAPASVAYQTAAAPATYASAGPVVQPHYSPAGSVSSFHFSNPHVTYSNLGLLSQVIGKAYTAPQASHAPQVAYSAAPAQAHYVTSGAQQVQYATPQVQYSAAPQVQYVQAAQQHYSAAPQVQYVQQAAHSSPQYVYSSAPTKTYSAGIQYAH